MDLIVEQSCPGCGAPIALHEDDRLIQCPFCDSHNYMVHSRLPRFALPIRTGRGMAAEEVFYVPYMRFKGCLYGCDDRSVRHSLIDTTRLATPLAHLPPSLGLRPQAMQLQPVTCRLPGQFLRQAIKAEVLLKQAIGLSEQLKGERSATLHHRSFIGETISKVYLPIYARGSAIYDGVTGEPLAEVATDQIQQAEWVKAEPAWEPQFLGTLCPNCGDGLRGSADSLVLLCANCDSCWREEAGRFEPVEWERLAGAKASTYLPFWRLTVTAPQPALASMADFFRWTNQPLVSRPEHAQAPLTIMVPAFKINPARFLTAAKNLTVVQPNLLPGSRSDLDRGKVYPVTLPLSEAIQALPAICAAMAVSPGLVMPQLPDLRFTVHRHQLVFLPFVENGHDFIQEQTGIAIQAAALRYGRSL